MTNTTDTDFARDKHDLYGKLSYVLPPTRFPYYVCIMGQSSIYARNIKKQMAGREPSVGGGGEVEAPYDSNLTWPSCGLKFRIGEIQKFKRYASTCTGTEF